MPLDLIINLIRRRCSSYIPRHSQPTLYFSALRGVCAVPFLKRDYMSHDWLLRLRQHFNYR